MSVAVRLAVALLTIAAPTLCFLGLMRGLERLRDDALLARIDEHEDAPRNGSRTTVRANGADGGRADGRGSHSETLDCPTCGAPNIRAATYCRRCLRELS